MSKAERGTKSDKKASRKKFKLQKLFTVESLPIHVIQMEKKDTHQAGLAKIVLPKWWNPCPGGYNFKTIDEMMIDEPMKQVLKGNGAIYQMTSLKQEEMTVKVYKNMISESPYTTPMSRHGVRSCSTGEAKLETYRLQSNHL